MLESVVSMLGPGVVRPVRVDGAIVVAVVLMLCGFGIFAVGPCDFELGIFLKIGMCLFGTFF